MNNYEGYKREVIMELSIYEFDNGVKVFDHHLLELQRQRYQQGENLHEPVEEGLFVPIVKHLAPGGHYVNLGAAIGYYPLLIKKIRPDVIIHAYEPLPSMQACFRENIGLNGWPLSAFHIFDEAIAAQNGYGWMYDHNYGSHVVLRQMKRKPFMVRFLKILSSRLGRKPNILQVKTLTLDRVIERVEGSVDLLQMDIQGLEQIALQSGEMLLRERKVKFLVFGTHSLEVHNNCLRILMDYGFSIKYENPEPQHQPDGLIVAKKY